ncbi:MAG: hypothetical protein HOK92_03260 [Flavobacteriales bacterium]|nr:hypothetical protein [Flavobacteriales bacterium]
MFFYFVIVLMSSSALAQDSLQIKQFKTNIIRMDKIMSKTGGSLEHLKVIHRQLKESAEVNQSEYNSMKKRYDEYIFNERILYIGEMNKMHEIERALVSLAILEQEFPDDKQVKDLSKVTKEATTERLKKNLKESKTSFTIEPSLSVFTIGKPLEEFTFFQSPGVNLMYGLGLYKVFNVHESYRRGFKKKFAYSQIGLKLDYFNGKGESINEEVTLDYINPQVSFIANRSLGLDIGYALIQKTTLPVDKGLCSFNLNAEFPIDFLSLGLNARVLTDFNEVNHIQYGLSLKYIFKLGNQLNQADLDSIQKSIETISIK